VYLLTISTLAANEAPAATAQDMATIRQRDRTCP
jgi:hypothetical protein